MKKWCDLLPWQSSKAVWTWSWETCSGWLYLSRGTGLDAFQRTLPTSTALILGQKDMSVRMLLQNFMCKQNRNLCRT